MPYQFLALTTFGHWDEILALPVPPADLSYSYGLAQYARGVAYAATGRAAEAQASLDSLVKTRGERQSRNTRRPDGPLPHRCWRSRSTRCAGRWRSAVAMPPRLLTTSRPPQPSRTGCSTSNRPTGTIRYAIHWVWHSSRQIVPPKPRAVYREDLLRFPSNGWALFGLVQSLKAQGKGHDRSVQAVPDGVGLRGYSADRLEVLELQYRVPSTEYREAPHVRRSTRYSVLGTRY